MASTGDLVAGRYRLLARVGSGGMGVVWHARDQSLNRPVAVKELVLRPDLNAAQRDEAVDRFRREGRNAAQLHHPNVTVVHDVADHDGSPYLIMEYVPSRSLAELLAGRPTLPAGEAAGIGFQMASALAAAHAAGIVHRDVKPGNVLLTADGTAKLTDFGIARSTGDDSLTPSGAVLGTPAYLAPEVAQGRDADFRSDVYSLGATLYRMLEGSPPHGENENTNALLYRIATTDPRPLTTRGPVTDVTRQMLARDPTRRPTIDAVRTALQRVASGERPTAVMPVPEPARGRRRLPVTIGVAAVIFTAVGVLVSRLVFGSTGSVAGAGAGSTTKTTIGAGVAVVPASLVPVGAGPSTPGQPTASTPAPTPTIDAAEQLRLALVGYWALLPAHPDQAWELLTTHNQQTHQGGYDEYAAYWQSIQEVDVARTLGAPPSTVYGTVTFVFLDGHRATMPMVFTFVLDQGTWKLEKGVPNGPTTTSG